MKSVHSGRVLGYVIDQNQPLRHAIFPTFFGVPAATAPTPAVIAMRSGAAVLFTVSVPLGDGRHKVIMEGPLVPPDTGDRDADVHRGEGEQCVAGRLIAQRARGAVRSPFDLLCLQPVHNGEAQHVRHIGCQNHDLRGGQALVINQHLDFMGHSIQQLGIEV